MWAVCCFSAACNCPDLWREYGGGGAGIMVEYPTPDGSSAGFAGKVIYSDEPVRLDLLRLDEHTAYRVFTTKTMQWAREREYRMVEPLDTPYSGRSFVYRDLQIASVTIGENLQSASVERIRQTCKQKGIVVKDA
jgi:hypothetical protein